jgi:hypothetical protein
MRRLLALLCCLLLIGSSNQFDSHNLRHQFAKLTSQSQRLAAIQLAYYHQQTQYLENLAFSNYWYLYLAELGSARFQWLLARHQHEQQQPQQRDYWLQRAAQQNHLPAIIDLIEYGPQSSRSEWLNLAAKNAPDELFDYTSSLKEYWANDLIFASYRALAEQGYQPAQEMHRLAEQYFNKPVLRQTSLPADCQQHITFVVTSVASAQRAESLVREFYADQQIQSLPICIRGIQGYQRSRLACSLKASARMNCEGEALWPDGPRDYRVFILDKGKAYVRGSAMYLDMQDSYAVFKHELAHWVGFVDEYKLPETLAKQFCNDNPPQIPNLIITAKSSPKPELTQHKLWRQLSHLNTAIARASTCDNTDYQAWRLVDRMTYMQFQELAMDEVYLALMKLTFADQIN